MRKAAMFSQFAQSVLALTGLALLISPVSAEALFQQVSKDFGGVPRGTQLTHHFRLSNSTQAPLHVASLKTSCGCATATIGRTEIPVGETTDVTVKIDTNKYSGSRNFTISVVFDQPFLQETQLIVSATSRTDLTIQPHEIAFGSIKRGTAPEASLSIQHYGYDSWQITGIENENGYILPKVENVTQFQGQTAYRLTVKLRNDIPPGHWHTDLWIKTNDPTTPRLHIPLTVDIQPNLTATPGEVIVGKVKPGSHTEKRVVVRGLSPFKIIRIDGGDQQCEVTMQSQDTARIVHVLTVSLTAGGEEQTLNHRFRVVTDLPGEEKTEFTLRAEIMP